MLTALDGSVDTKGHHSFENRCDIGRRRDVGLSTEKSVLTPHQLVVDAIAQRDHETKRPLSMRLIMLGPPGAKRALKLRRLPPAIVNL
jgi:hypothetical protein